MITKMYISARDVEGGSREFSIKTRNEGADRYDGSEVIVKVRKSRLTEALEWLR